MKRLRNWTTPRNVCRSSRLVEGSIGSMESIFRGSGWRPSAPMIRPKKGIRVHLNLNLSSLDEVKTSFTSTLKNSAKVFIMIAKITVVAIYNNLIRNSSDTYQITKGFAHFPLENVRAQTRPKCRRKNQYLPNGELKVVNSELSLVSLIFQ